MDIKQLILNDIDEYESYIHKSDMEDIISKRLDGMSITPEEPAKYAVESEFFTGSYSPLEYKPLDFDKPPFPRVPDKD